VASNRAPTNFSVPKSLEILKRRTDKQADDFAYTIPCTNLELGADCTFISLEKADVKDVASMDYISASVINVYER
jgi:hypothetical protein